MASSAQSRPEAAAYRPAAAPDGSLDCISWREMAGEIAAWDALARRAAEPNPFHESWYLLPSLSHFDEAVEVSILRFTRQGALCGLMPVVRRSHYEGWPLAHIAGWLHPNIFFGTPLVAAGAEAPFWRAVLAWADANPGLALFLHLHEIALDGAVWTALESVLAEDGRPAGIVERKQRALLASEIDAEAYLEQALSARKRKDLNRRFRRLAELGEVAFRWQTGTDGLVRWIDEFLALEAAGWKGEAGSALACDAATAALFRDSLTGAGERDRLLRLSLRLDDRPIAMLSTFLAPPGGFGFKTAFCEEHARFGPGLLLEREFLGVLDRFGLAWCDSCAAPDHSVMNDIWRERRPLGRVSIAIGGPLRRAAFAPILRKEMPDPEPGADA